MKKKKVIQKKRIISKKENTNKVNELEGKLNENYKKILKKNDDDRNGINRQIENLKLRINNMGSTGDEDYKK